MTARVSFQPSPPTDRALLQRQGAPHQPLSRDSIGLRDRVRSRMAQSHVSPVLVFADVLAVAIVTAGGALLGARTWSTILVGAVTLATVGGVPERTTLALSTLEQVPWLIRRMATGYLLAAPLFLLGDRSLTPVSLAVAATTAVVLARGVASVVLRRLRSRGRGLERTLVVGLGPGSYRFVEQVAAIPRYGMSVIGMISDHSDAVHSDPESESIGHLSDLPTLVQALGVSRVIVGPDVAGSRERAVALRATQAAGARVHLIPRMAEVMPPTEPPYEELVRGLPITELPPAVPGGPRWWLKRAIDVVLASTLLVVFSPVMVLIAIAVKRSSPGPALFRQQRVGRRGLEFTMLKFRTFPVEHRDVVQSLGHGDCPLRFGRFLRRSSLDEVPQLLNVIRGDMSLIGPRPERPHFAEPLSRVLPDYDDRHRVRGGMTGLAQTMGFVGNTSIEDRVLLDNRYIDGWSLWRDVLIVARTVAAIIRKAG